MYGLQYLLFSRSHCLLIEACQFTFKKKNLTSMYLNAWRYYFEQKCHMSKKLGEVKLDFRACTDVLSNLNYSISKKVYILANKL